MYAINVYQLWKNPYMARTTRPLTHTEVQKAKALEKDLTLHDGDGLFLLVKTTGKKLWRFRYLRPGTSSRIMVSLGADPACHLPTPGKYVPKSSRYWQEALTHRPKKQKRRNKSR